MDVVLSIVAGLGLRVFLITAGPREILTAALLGIWEGVILHQLSARSHSPHPDHVIAYVLRLVADLFISKNLLRLFMVLLWTAFGSLISEAVSPHASLRSALRRRRERERRHRHSRSSSEALPIPSSPPPLRVRTTRPNHSESHSLVSQAPQQLSTPLVPSIPPQTPPSFFLHGISDIDSPSPKPIHLQLLQPLDSPTVNLLPVRPRSGLASILERSPSSLPNAHNLLPTPPESAQSAAHSDAPDIQNNGTDVHDSTKTLSPRRLSPIAELSSPDITPPETVDPQNKIEFDQNQQSPSLPLLEPIHPAVFNVVAYSSPLLNPDQIFAPIASPAAPIPPPIPQQNRQDPLWQTRIMPRIYVPHLLDYNDDLNADHDNTDDRSSDSDELQTPDLRDTLNAETDNENDDPLLTPIQMKSAEVLEAERGQLSPLGLNVNSGLESDDHIHLSDAEGDSSDPPPETNNKFLEELHIRGSLSQNFLLQPSLPPSGSLLRPSSPRTSHVPPSPSTIFSDITILSQLSTRVPSKLFLKAEEYRKQARQEEQSREQLDIERKAAEAQGRTVEALMLKIRLRELDDRVYKLHEKAARRYYASRNPLERSGRIDLHGLRPREAYVRAERALVKAIKEGRRTMYLIVGQGKHSVNGKPVLKKTVQNEIIRNGFKCEVDERNPGVLVVALPPPRLPP